MKSGTYSRRILFEISPTVVATLKTLHHNNLSWNLIHSCLLQGLYLDPHVGAHGHGLAVSLWENFWNLITDKNFHIHPKWERLAEWITKYPSLATIITDSWLILFYLCPYPLFIHPTPYWIPESFQRKSWNLSLWW